MVKTRRKSAMSEGEPALIGHFFSRDLERHRLELQAEYQRQFEQFRLEMQGQVASAERVRAEIYRWANPILGAVGALHRRLGNILGSGFVALTKGREATEDWTIDYDYFMYSSLYRFAAYFCWVEHLWDNLSFEIFQSQHEMDRFFKAIGDASEALGTYPVRQYRCQGRDVQVFDLQWRAVGQMMMAKTASGRPGCMSYDKFLERCDEPRYESRLRPLRVLLEGVAPLPRADRATVEAVSGGAEEEEPLYDCRWMRLNRTHRALGELQALCVQHLGVDAAGMP